MTNPLVSVIVSNYNYGRYLGAAIESVLAQTYPDIEVIVVDDGSTDCTPDVLDRFADGIVVIRQKNAGQAAALNAGFRRSTGAYICLMDADDIWFPEKVAASVDVFEREPEVSWVCHQMEMTDAELRPAGTRIPMLPVYGLLPRGRYLYLERVIRAPTPSLVFRRALAERLFPIPEGPIPVDRNEWAPTVAFDPDAYLVACCGADEAVRGYAIGQVLGYYRRRTGEGAIDDELVIRILKRAVGVEQRASLAWSDWSGTRAVATTITKHQLIIDWLSGQRRWSLRRFRTIVAAVPSITRLAAHSPRLAIRQSTGLLLAFTAPRHWTDRFVRRTLVES